MRTILALFCSLCIISSAIAQDEKEKVKGNKIVNTEEYEMPGFRAIEIHQNFNVSIEQSSFNMVRVEADSNLHDLIKVGVQSDVLLIESTKSIKKAKKLNIEIFYTNEISSIKVFNEAEVKSISPIESENLKIYTYDDAEVLITSEIKKLECVANGKSKLESHAKAKDIFYQINDNAQIKSIVTSDSLKVDLYQKGAARLEGKAKSMLLRADNDGEFYGEKLSAKKVSLIAEGKSKCYTLTKKEINIEAKDKSQVYILGAPKINIDTFTNEATLYKKEIDFKTNKIKL